MTPDLAEKAGRRSVVGGAALIAFGTLLSRCLGLVRDMLIARYFSNDVRDAFVTAFRLPNLFRKALGEGSLSISFVPVFVGLLGEEPNRTRARALVANILSLVVAVSATVTALAILLMDDLLRLVLSGHAYASVPGKIELTVRLARIMFALLLAMTVFAFFTAVLNGMKKFALAAVAPALFNFVVIVAALAGAFLPTNWAQPEIVLAWAVLVGGVLQAAVLLPPIARAGLMVKLRPSGRSSPESSASTSFVAAGGGASGERFKVNWASGDVLRVLKAALPSVFAASFLQLVALVNVFFASHLPSGSTSYLYFADRVFELPLSLFVVSVSSALLPELSAQWSSGNRDGMLAAIHHSLRLVLFFAIPAAIGLFCLSQPIANVLFLGREFKYADAVQTAQVLQVQAVAIVVVALARILAQGFYAIQNAWFPALASGVALVTHVFFAFGLTEAFGLRGLAAAAIFSALVNTLMLTTAYRSWIGKISFQRIGRSVAINVGCGAVMFGVLQLHAPFANFAQHVLGVSIATQAVALAVVIGLGAGSYFASAYAFKVPECHEALNMIRAKLKRHRR